MGRVSKYYLAIIKEEGTTIIDSFEHILSLLLDYYGNFEENSQIAACIEQAEQSGSYTEYIVTDDALEDITAAGDPASSILQKSKNREPHEPA
ncbi:MAG: hypothetical protein LBD93_11075 [Treponema sp.]|nr:hypothetical protein [Treponema sp.]